MQVTAPSHTLAVAYSTVTHLHARALNHATTASGGHWLYRCISHGHPLLDQRLRQAELVPHPTRSFDCGFRATAAGPSWREAHVSMIRTHELDE